MQRYANLFCSQAFINLHIAISVFHNWSSLERIQLVNCSVTIRRLRGGLKFAYLHVFFRMWVMAFTVKYGMWTCDCCKAADVNGSRVGPLWLFTFLWEVNKNGVLTGTWMKGAVSAVYCCYAVLKNKQVSYATLCLWRCLFAELPRGIPHAERKMWQKRSYSTRWEGKSAALP